MNDYTGYAEKPIIGGNESMRYNRASLEAAIRMAKKLKRVSFVHATAHGFAISRTAPPANQPYVRIDEQGNMFYHDPTIKKGDDNEQAERPLVYPCL